MDTPLSSYEWIKNRDYEQESGDFGLKNENVYGNEQKNSEEGWEGDNWQENIRTGEPEADSTGKGSKRKGKTQLLTIIQIFSCLVILAAAVLLRLYGGNLYDSVRTWYLTALNDSVLAEEEIGKAKRTVVDLWSWISSAGPKSGESSLPVSSSASRAEGSASSALPSAGGTSTTGKIP